MADFIPPLIAYLTANISGFQAKMGEATAVAKAETTAMGGAFNTLATVGKAAVLGLGAAAIVGGVAAVKMGSDFQAKMELIRTQAHDTTDSIDDLGKQVLALAGQVGQGPEQLAEGLYHVASVGYTGAAAIEILKQAAIEASVSGANLDDTTYSLTSVMNTFGLGAKDAAGTMATLNAIVGAGDMRFQDLNGAISTGFLAAGKTFGVSLQSMGAALDFLTDRGASAEESATRLKMSITLLGAPTAQSAGLLKDMGLASDEAASRSSAMNEMLAKSGLTITRLSQDLRKPDGLQVALVDLKTSMEKAGLSADAQAALISRAFGGGRSGAAIMAMIGQTDVLGQKFDAVGKGAARFGQDWADTEATFSNRMARMRAGTEALGISIGIKLIPYVSAAIDKISVWIEWLTKNQQVSIPLAIAIGTVLVAAVIAYTIAMVQAAVATILATWPILLIIAAIAVLAVGLYLLVTHWSQVVGWLRTAKDWFVNVAQSVIHLVEQNQLLMTVFTALAGPINALIVLVKTLADHWSSLVGAVEAAAGAVQKFIDTAHNMPVLGGAMNLALGFPSMDSGGYVPGPVGAPRLIVAHGGEYVSPVGAGTGPDGGMSMEDTNDLLGALYQLLDERLPRRPVNFSNRAYNPV